MTHTKGKWEVDEIRGCKVVVCGSMVIASDLFDENEEPSIEELDANANLIAAAPDLLEAAVALFSWLDFGDYDWGGVPETPEMINLRKAIAKAEGK